MIKEAMLYDELPEGKVHCKVCGWSCIISPGRVGACKIRKNLEGKLFSLIYSSATSEAVDPIEKKPVFHYLPGSLCYSLGTVSCNFRCKNCQNWTISQVRLDEALTVEISPQEAVRRAQATRCKSIAWTYNEPAIWFEYTYDTAKLARKAGLKTVYVTNGYITQEALRTIAPYLDVFRVDIKSLSEGFYREICGARLAPVLEASRLARELGMHIEVITLIIPTLNDSLEEITNLVRWVRDNLGANTPLHFSRFHPHYKLGRLPPTPVSTLEKAYEIAKQEGIRYPYLGNVFGHRYEDTYCPKCNELLIARSGFSIKRNKITENKKCPRCGEGIDIVI